MKQVFRCLPLQLSNANPDLPEIRAAFANSESISMGQAWLPELETAFRPATVATAWTIEEFLVFAILKDEDIYSDAKNLKLTPEVFTRRVWIENGCWSVLARIPFSELQLPERPVGCESAFSFRRLLQLFLNNLLQLGINAHRRRAIRESLFDIGRCAARVNGGDVRDCQEFLRGPERERMIREGYSPNAPRRGDSKRRDKFRRYDGSCNKYSLLENSANLRLTHLCGFTGDTGNSNPSNAG